MFADGLEPGAGPGLVLQALPIAFGRIPGGWIRATVSSREELRLAFSYDVWLVLIGRGRNDGRDVSG